MKMTFNVCSEKDMNGNKLLHVKVIHEHEDNELLTNYILYGDINNLTACVTIKELVEKYSSSRASNSASKNITNMSDDEIDKYIDNMIKLLKKLTNEFDEYATKIRKKRNKLCVYEHDWKLIV